MAGNDQKIKATIVLDTDLKDVEKAIQDLNKLAKEAEELNKAFGGGAGSSKQGQAGQVQNYVQQRRSIQGIAEKVQNAKNPGHAEQTATNAYFAKRAKEVGQLKANEEFAEYRRMRNYYQNAEAREQRTQQRTLNKQMSTDRLEQDRQEREERRRQDRKEAEDRRQQRKQMAPHERLADMQKEYDELDSKRSLGSDVWEDVAKKQKALARQIMMDPNASQDVAEKFHGLYGNRVEELKGYAKARREAATADREANKWYTENQRALRKEAEAQAVPGKLVQDLVDSRKRRQALASASPDTNSPEYLQMQQGMASKEMGILKQLLNNPYTSPEQFRGAAAGFQATAKDYKDLGAQIKKLTDTSEEANQQKVKELRQQQDLYHQAELSSPDKGTRKIFAMKQADIYGRLIEHSNDPEEMAALAKQRRTLEKQYNINPDQSAFALYGMGMAAVKLGGLAAMPAQMGMSAFTQLNNSYTMDRGLDESDRMRTGTLLGLGSQLSGYQQFKNSIGSSLMNMPGMAGAGIAGDVLGKASGPAGEMLTTYALLKGAGVGLPTLGALAGGAVLPGLVGLLGAGILGGSALGANAMKGGPDPLTNVLAAFNPEAAGKHMVDIGWDAARQQPREYQDSRRQLLDQGMNAYGSVQTSFKSVQDLEKEMNQLKTQSTLGGADERKKAASQLEGVAEDLQKARQKLKQATDSFGDFAKKAGYGNWDQLDEKQKQIAIGALKEEATRRGITVPGEETNLTKILNSDEFKLQGKALNNQVADFQQDSQRQQMQLDRGYQRSTADISKQRTRMLEDYKFNLQKLNIQRQRADQDYARNTQTLDIQVYRVKRDNQLQLSRLNEDTARSRLRLEQDTTRSLTRLDQDYTTTITRSTEDRNKQMYRLQSDSNRNLARLQEDSSRNLSRLNEDSARERQRTMEDYATNKQKLNTSFARNEQDLNLNFQDSLVGILAPQLAQSKGYQLQKLFRDYKLNKSRLNQDKATEYGQLERDKNRSLDDINRNQQRGTEDINRELSRGQEDIARELQRGAQDIATNFARSIEDALKNYTRGKEDINTNYSRSTEDINTQESRGKADLARSLGDQLQDADRQRLELAVQYNRTKQDLDMQEFEMQRNLKRGMEDLTTAYQRSTEDYKTATDQLNIQVQRFGRDFAMTIQQLMQQVTKAAGAPLMNPGDFQKQAGIVSPDWAPTGGSPTNPTLSQQYGTGAPNPNPSLSEQYGNGGNGTGQTGNYSGGSGSSTGTGGGSTLTPVNGNQPPAVPTDPRLNPQPLNGSFAIGLNSVAYDGFRAELHEGEMVVPRDAAQDLRGMGFGSGSGWKASSIGYSLGGSNDYGGPDAPMIPGSPHIGTGSSMGSGNYNSGGGSGSAISTGGGGTSGGWYTNWKAVGGSPFGGSPEGTAGTFGGGMGGYTPGRPIGGPVGTGATVTGGGAGFNLDNGWKPGISRWGRDQNQFVVNMGSVMGSSAGGGYSNTISPPVSGGSGGGWSSPAITVNVSAGYGSGDFKAMVQSEANIFGKRIDNRMKGLGY